MKYYSTQKESSPVSFKDAVLHGMPVDGGLFMPERIPALEKDFLNDITSNSLSRVEIAVAVAEKFIGGEIQADSLVSIIEETLSFEIPLVRISENIFTLELFHGPTMAFKDIGARFLARCLGYFSAGIEKEITVLVATSGDTGSAVANGFYEVPGVRVVILYPSGKISDFQEKQMTTLGKNIIALEVDGTFDDCQYLVKAAFADTDMKKKLTLTSANSINVARLIPQTFYYFFAVSQLGVPDPMVSVPSGNYGNLTAGLLAKRMGLPIASFVASSNQNDIVPHYLHTGDFIPKPSVQTISNAMDVGNPSNFVRMQYLFNDSLDTMRNEILGFSFSEAETRSIIWDVRDKYGYILDPHGAVGYLGLELGLHSREGILGIFLETAHPSKFRDVVEPILEEKINVPEGYQMEEGIKLSIPIKNDLEAIKEILL